MKKTCFQIIIILPVLFTAACEQHRQPVYTDASRPVEKRVKDLISRMTLEEKTAQMQVVFFSDFMFGGNTVDTVKVHKALDGMNYGAAVSHLSQTGKDLAQSIALYEKYISEHNRLKIPVIYVTEALHGLLQNGATIFPQSVALGSTFDTELMYRVAGQIALEARTAGIGQVLSPDLDLARELRWGRVEETFGEDPYLAGQMGIAYVKAFNGQKVICTPKHFVAHGSPAGGLNLASVAGGERDLYSIYIKPFADVIRETSPYSIMNPYSSYEGVPVAASKKMMTGILRDELGFKGYVSSDWGSVEMLYSFHKTSENEEDAALQAVQAGIDCEVGSKCYKHLNQLVKEGKLSEKEIDRCVERILHVKFAMGMFDEPNIPDTVNVSSVIHTPAAIELSLEAARESAVLLKNDNGLLPLQAGKLKSVAVIGPNAAKTRFGSYSWTNGGDYGISPLEGIQAITEGKIKINYAEGCNVWSQDKSGFSKAVDAARASDVALLFVGTESAYPGLRAEGAVSGESYDLSDLSLPGVQEELIKAVAATGTPVVLALVSGKPLAIAWEKEHIPAIVLQWYAGEQQGRAIAEILFGKVNPSGKLNVSFPQSTGHLPVYYNHYPTDKGFYKQSGTPGKPGLDYVFSDPAPLWAFGHGLSYTSFDYKNIRVEQDSLTEDRTIRIEADITNTGAMDGKEVVQLYVRDKYASVVTPVKELKRFEKIFLKKGETKTVTFTLPVGELALYDRQMKKKVEPGEFELQTGSASDKIHSIKNIIITDKK